MHDNTVKEALDLQSKACIWTQTMKNLPYSAPNSMSYVDARKLTVTFKILLNRKLRVIRGVADSHKRCHGSR